MGHMRRHAPDTTDDLELFARCAAGFESVLARELKGLRLRRVRPLKGGVAFFGTLSDAYRACLWSRVATRVQLVLARLDARDADALYAGCSRFAWEALVKPGATIAVQAHGENPSLRNTQFTALKVKDAVCDRLRERRGSRPDVDARDPDVAIDVSIHASHATLYLNLSGQSLHRRGYREQGVQTEAPLKETLAAGMLLAAGWDELAGQGATFADPMCGSGTLVIEAALIAADVAPGSLRARWGFEGWLGHDEGVWQELVADARRRADTGVAACGSSIIGGDLDGRAVSIATENARSAGVGDIVHLGTADASTLAHRIQTVCDTMPKLGLVAVNPPYGKRIGHASDLPATYAALARGIEGLGDGWRLATISPDTGLDTALGMAADEVIPCYNGPIRSSVRIFSSVATTRTEIAVTTLSGDQRAIAVAEPNSEQFAARLRKAAKERAKWARRSGITCYRVYDADLPDYALSVDVFEDVSGACLARIVEHPAPASVDENRADRRFADAAALVSAVLDIPRERLATVPRPRGDDAGREASPLVATVTEDGLSLEVNVGARQDTGLPLDLRPVRQLVRELAPGRRFLSLGSYAGVPATFAAAGGAASTLTVDSSSTYLDWARRNLDANGFSGKRHLTTRTPRPGTSFDLVYADASALAGRGISDLASLLAPHATLILTSGSKTFRIDEGQLGASALTLEDVSAQTIPHDFSRTPKVHRCWLLTRG